MWSSCLACRRMLFKKSKLPRISFEAFPGFGACWNQLELLADKSLETKAFDLLVSNGTKTKYVSLKQKGSKKNLSKSHSAKSVIKKMQNVLKLPNMWFFSPHLLNQIIICITRLNDVEFFYNIPYKQCFFIWRKECTLNRISAQPTFLKTNISALHLLILLSWILKKAPPRFAVWRHIQFLQEIYLAQLKILHTRFWCNF